MIVCCLGLVIKIVDDCCWVDDFGQKGFFVKLRVRGDGHTCENVPYKFIRILKKGLEYKFCLVH